MPVLLGGCTSPCILFALELHPKRVHQHEFAVHFIHLREAGFGIKLFERGPKCLEMVPLLISFVSFQ